MKHIILFLSLLTGYCSMVCAQDVTLPVTLVTKKQGSTLQCTSLKELTLLDDTTYLHINLKFFMENIADTAIIYIRNWNFCFYTSEAVIEGRNATKDKVLFFSLPGVPNFAENLILISPKSFLTADMTLGYNKEGCYIQGHKNEFCISSDFRKLCGEDTLEIDFWLSDPRFIDSYKSSTLIEPRLFFLRKQSEDIQPKTFSEIPLFDLNFWEGMGIMIPPDVYNSIPILTQKELDISIKNPLPMIEKSRYYGHIYQLSSDISNCEQKYELRTNRLIPK